jgi:hypothetical protein
VEDLVQLSYAPPPRWHQRPSFRWLLRRVVVLILLLLAIYWITLGWPALKVRIAERRAARYTPPPKHVAYDDDPLTYAELLSSGAGFLASSTSISGNQYAVYNNPAWVNWVGRVAPTVFLHGMTTPGGKPRIAAVQVGSNPATLANRFFLMPYIAFGSGITGPGGAAIKGSPSLQLFRAPHDRLRIYDGRIDPSNASRFTLDIDYNDQRIVITGRLLNDDTIVLTPSAGLLATFIQERWWMPPGVAVPAQFEPSYFVDIATAQPILYPGPTQRGRRIVYGADGQLIMEKDHPATRPNTTRW